jgi:hypothetical protein
VEIWITVLGSAKGRESNVRITAQELISSAGPRAPATQSKKAYWILCMQILEGSVWSLRTVRFNLVSPGNKISITLFPMVHVGEAEFFEVVYADAFSHDIALVEGVDSPIVRRITRSYRWIAASRTLNLVVQPAYPNQARCRAKIIPTDLSAEEFVGLWANIPIWLRIFVYIAALLMGLWVRWFGSRDALARNLTLDDLPRRNETLAFSPEAAALDRVILDARDAKLVERLCEYVENSESMIDRISVVYGAQHMRAVLRELRRRYGYQVKNTDWLTVFKIK